MNKHKKAVTSRNEKLAKTNTTSAHGKSKSGTAAPIASFWVGDHELVHGIVIQPGGRRLSVVDSAIEGKLYNPSQSLYDLVDESEQLAAYKVGFALASKSRLNRLGLEYDEAALLGLISEIIHTQTKFGDFYTVKALYNMAVEIVKFTPGLTCPSFKSWKKIFAAIALETEPLLFMGYCWEHQTIFEGTSKAEEVFWPAPSPDCVGIFPPTDSPGRLDFDFNHRFEPEQPDRPKMKVNPSIKTDEKPKQEDLLPTSKDTCHLGRRTELNADAPVHVNEFWSDMIKKAQLQTTYRINGKEVKRLRYGEDWCADYGADTRPCHDCAVTKGQFHVPGCDAEQCPKCRGQAFICPCVDHEEEEEAGT